MKQADVLWVQQLAYHAGAHIEVKHWTVHDTAAAQSLFFDELGPLLEEYCQYFNELVQAEKPDAVCKVFRFSSARPGIMILRGKEKLVVSGEGARVGVRAVQIHAFQEVSYDVCNFEAQLTPDRELVWISPTTNARVNPELVAKEYLGKFLAHGCAVFIPRHGAKAFPENQTELR